MNVITTSFYNMCDAVVPYAKTAQREVCVALEGMAHTTPATIVTNLGVTGAAASVGVYGAYRMFKAKSVAEAAKFSLVSVAGFAIAAREVHRNFTDYQTLAVKMCSSAHGNRFPGWERCSDIALGTFSYLSDKLQFTGYFSCPQIPR